ncbi:MAG: GH92 family glycosyl hydrolase [Bacteroidales bacterium]
MHKENKHDNPNDLVRYINPYIGGISHLLVPTYPTIHLPNSMLRVYPEREDYTSDILYGLPLIVTSHRGKSAFKLSPYQSDSLHPVITYSYDNEILKPYYYEVMLDDQQIHVEFAPSHQSALYSISYSNSNKPCYMMVNTLNGSIRTGNGFISGHQLLENNTKVYIYLEPEVAPEKTGILENKTINTQKMEAHGHNVCAAMLFAKGSNQIRLRYGISFISEEQAKKNMLRELPNYDVSKLAEQGKQIWNDALGTIRINGGEEQNKEVFYTSLYRVFERPICISEDNYYYSAFDGRVHNDNGTAFYTDDWIWDTYRAAHPLRLLTHQKLEADVISSYLRMAEQMGNMWMPTFPEVTGDSRRMNSNHAVATVADAYVKGVKIDLEKAYEACRKGIEEKTLIPWSGAKAGWLDRFYKENGYIPALRPDEKETVEHVGGEKRQPIAVTLGTSYDQWCLSVLATALGRKNEAEYYLKCSQNYRNIYNAETGFFHPKDKEGNWITPFDYRFSGGQGARDFYGENNGWIYRWDVPHNIPDLINLMGGNECFITNLDQTFREPLGRGKYDFYSQLPDHTGNVGQYSMANEPSLHIPYLYNFAKQPWKTQKRIRNLINTWFRSDLMGVPGDEDGGGMSAFVVFSSLGFYPVTPGSPIYQIGSPLFPNALVKLSNGKTFEIESINVSHENKYIQSAELNGKRWNKSWFHHDDLSNGGKLVLIMGNTPNKQWGID